MSPPAEMRFAGSVAFGKVLTSGERRQLFVDEGKGGQLYPLQVWVSNRLEEQADYGLVLFLDFHQVPLAGRDVTVIHLEPGELAVIDAELMLPDEPGVHQLQLMWFADPYRSVLNDEVAFSFVFGSPRIAIDVN